jgi:transcription-repair coupling factor (superfamily II helicase)
MRAQGNARSIVWCVADERRARALATNLNFYGSFTAEGQEDVIVVVPELDVSPWADEIADPRQIAQRMGALERLLSGGPKIVICSVRSLMRRTVAPQIFEKHRDCWRKGQELDRDYAIEWLIGAGYLRTELVEEPGTFAVRGGILDLYVPLSRFPARLEWDGDTIEKIRLFDATSQRGLREVDEISVHLVRESLRTRSGDWRAPITKLADSLSIPSSRMKVVLDNLAQNLTFLGVEALVPVLHDEMRELWSYFPDQALWIAEEPESLQRLAESIEEANEASYVSRRTELMLACEPRAFFVTAATLRTKIADATVWHGTFALDRDDAETSADSRPWLRARSDAHRHLRLALAAARSDHTGDLLAPLIEESNLLIHEPNRASLNAGLLAPAAWRVALVAPNRAQSERLMHVLSGHGLQVAVHNAWSSFIEARANDRTLLHVVIGDLIEGFASADENVAVFTEHDLFGKRTLKTKPGRSQVGVASLSQLRTGDYVVHLVHGIGRYLGLARLKMRDVPAEFVQIEYQKGDKLYLPVHRLSEIERYSAAQDEAPKLDKMGGTTFATRTSKVKADVRQLAEELLALYSQRQALAGHAFDPPGEEYEEFEATFPFEETPDQAAAIAAVQADLSSDEPMDRIVCGDVGFGKTEVALRAAFRVSSQGKQVVILAPTTVLVQQHYQTFSERMSAFPLRVASVNRFVAPKVVAQVLEGLRNGSVDIVVGTHRLLAQDVRFKDLGLVIIDEEQRFGVKQKERLKALKTQVDLLTLSATPIPRTLHFALMGLRSVSMITTPPVDRLSVRTHVVRQSDSLIQEAIVREIERGGQVYFVMPRIEGLEAEARRIASLVPNAKVAIAHGQLDNDVLEKTMLGFIAHEFDVLVTTTIVESGLDIPRANTMLIARSDLFGLAQLYQLRGRVGRSRVRAECYLMVHSLDKLSDDARRRLEAIARNSELGAGFNIASHDLEMRGAGDLLGARQSGSMQKIGFQAYSRALAEAVAEVRGDPIIREHEVDLNMDVPAFIPDEYVDDIGQRLEFYRRFSQAKDEDEVRSIQSELYDRYGQQPLELIHYADIMVLKAQARSMRAFGLELQGARFSVRLADDSNLDRKALARLATSMKERLKMPADNRLTYRAVERTGDDATKTLSSCQDILRRILSCATEEAAKGSTNAPRLRR